MDNARAALIIAALFVVLLSAFGVGHYPPCTGQKPCAGRMPASFLPGARLAPAATAPALAPAAQAIHREALDDSAARGSVQDR